MLDLSGNSTREIRMGQFTLRVYIHGLVALVRNDDGHLDVVLVKEPQTEDHAQHNCHKHYSFLAARASSATGHYLEGADYSDNSYKAVWNPVDDFEVSFHATEDNSAGDGPVRNYSLDPPQNLGAPNPQENFLSDTDWIFPLSSILPINPNYRSHAKSAMILRGGTLKTRSLSTLRPANQVIGPQSLLEAPVFTLNLNGANHTQALADSVVWERTFDGERLVVSASPLVGGNVERTMMLKPYEANSPSDLYIDLFYANPPRRFRKNHPCYDPQGDRRVQHFSMYYPLFDTSSLPPSQLQNIPESHSGAPSVGGFPSLSRTLDGQPLPLAEDIDERLLSGALASDKQSCVIVQ
ncbi:MAG: hypothetical protein SX243_14690 [Acidobacteriota bacterium]|nr:hypothetical protein [Acidobacteriota bacterium]